MKRSIFAIGSAAVVTLVLAIAACTTIDGGFKRSTGLCSTPQEHCLNVYLVNNHIEVDVTELYVVGPNHMIYWQLDSASAPGYVFPSNGIVFPPSGASEFVDCHPIHGGTIFFCRDLNTRPGRYKYTINLTGPRPIPALDPSVVNG
jgi:hypothetical protein